MANPSVSGGTLATVARNAGYAVLGRGLNVALVPLFAVVTANALGPESFGRLALGLSLASLAQIAAEFGMPTMLARTIAVDRREASSLVGASLAVSFLGSIVAGGIVLGIALFIDDRTTGLCAMTLATGVFFLALGRVTEGVAAGFERFEFQILPSIARNVAVTVFCLPFAVLFPEHLLALAGVLVGSWTIASLSAAWFTARRLRVVAARPAGARVLAAARAGIPYAAMPLASMVYYRNDVWIISALSGAQDTGVYQAAYALLDWTNSLPSIGAAVLLPTLSGLFARDRENFASTLARYVRGVSLGTPLLCAAALGVCSILLPYYRTGYGDSYKIGMILSLAAAPSTLNMLAGTCLIVVHRPYLPVVAVGLAAIAKAVLNALAVRAFGPQGAAVVAVGMEWLLAIAQTALMWRYLARSQRGATIMSILGGALTGSVAIGGAWFLFGTGAGLAAAVVYALLSCKTEPAREAISSVRSIAALKWGKLTGRNETPS